LFIAMKTGKVEDANNNNIPDAVEEKFAEVKEEVKEVIAEVKEEVEEVVEKVKKVAAKKVTANTTAPKAKKATKKK